MTKTPQQLADFLANYNRWLRSGFDEHMIDPMDLVEAIDQVVGILEDLPKRVLSDCCQAPAVVAGKPNSTQWHVCPQCSQPCDVFYQDNETTQPQL